GYTTAPVLKVVQVLTRSGLGRHSSPLGVGARAGPRAGIAELVGPGSTGGVVSTAQVSRLRKSLRPAGGQLLLTRGTGYQLNVGADELDVLLFERLLEQAGSALGEGDAAGAAAPR